MLRRPNRAATAVCPLTTETPLEDPERVGDGVETLDVGGETREGRNQKWESDRRRIHSIIALVHTILSGGLRCLTLRLMTAHTECSRGFIRKGARSTFPFVTRVDWLTHWLTHWLTRRLTCKSRTDRSS